MKAKKQMDIKAADLGCGGAIEGWVTKQARIHVGHVLWQVSPEPGMPLQLRQADALCWVGHQDL